MKDGIVALGIFKVAIAWTSFGLVCKFVGCGVFRPRILLETGYCILSRVILFFFRVGTRRLIWQLNLHLFASIYIGEDCT